MQRGCQVTIIAVEEKLRLQNVSCLSVAQINDQCANQAASLATSVVHLLSNCRKFWTSFWRPRVWYEDAVLVYAAMELLCWMSLGFPLFFFLMTFLFCLAKRLLEVNFIELNITNLLKPFEERMPTVNEFYTLCINASSYNSLKFSSSICFGTKLYFKRLVRSIWLVFQYLDGPSCVGKAWLQRWVFQEKLQLLLLYVLMCSLLS